MDKKSDKFYERQFVFAVNCQKFCRKLIKNTSNKIYSQQLIRSSSSIGANYIEALEALSKKDFIHRLRICRKESRESIHWLKLMKETDSNSKKIDALNLIEEANQYIKIFSSAIITSESRKQ